ncbi:beta-ketoacyl synthase N-terminal-like domain-containing protein [Chitinophaga nivalis]|uniref:Polyketide synthase dehydratase domain-containing protein n=1 Tax=Chitinophaga nivalis TaxID=2991709 RepID=A0ABT3IMW6_9BACT|nr:beta-ketoacyl synthase N-terminal-like domain-containing protein [Chitinophaga nivalis]MCW3464995.1 polyketide synthase dehydratase domain-containing protein [Chitinophaga nivalis]MCW3485313.1 polyketide synthase dehydratase domain-containing protein [Chitinophaga nivalis]
MAIHFLEYVLNELREKRLCKEDAKNLIRQFYNPSHKTGDTTVLHPLLHRNTSTLGALHFSSTFSGEEFFLQDYLVHGQALLPAAAFLEMARAAVLEAGIAAEQAAVAFNDVIWTMPLVAGTADTTVHIALYQERSILYFDSYSTAASGAEQLHCQGKVGVVNSAPPPVYNLTLLQAGCKRGYLSGAQCYQAFEQQGVLYGAACNCVEGLWQGEEEVLVKLFLQDMTQEQYILHPGLLEGVWQGCIGLSRNGKVFTAAGYLMPDAVDKVLIYEGTTINRTYWCVVRYCTDGAPSATSSRVNIDMCDDNGKVIVRLLGLRLRAVTGELHIAAATPIPTEHVTAAPPSTWDTRVLQLLLREVSTQLGIPEAQLNGDMQLNELGLDSIQLVQFSKKLQASYGIVVTPELFFGAPTLKIFAAHIIKTYQEGAAVKLPGLLMQELLAAPAAITANATRPSRRQTASLPDTVMAGEQAAVAVIGISARFPHAEGVTEFWKNLTEERDCISEVPRERWDWRTLSDEQADAASLRWGGFIADITAFDAAFFNIAPEEAMYMDPQQRLLMEYVWKVIADAGYSAAQLWGTPTGLFVATTCGEYEQLLSAAGRKRVPAGMASAGPNRVSRFFNLHGPSEPVETACSSSLAAIHKAVAYIQQGHGEMAIAGGINTLLSPAGYGNLAQAGMLSADGRCKAFGVAADGYVRGEGIGMLLLKRRDAAERDGDQIYGVIRTSAENHSGYADAFTAAGSHVKAAWLQQVYARAGISPRTIGYIETHTTGIRLEDAAEINALKAAFRMLPQQDDRYQNTHGYCGLGTVKSNIGHLELAAGVAGLIKVLLQLKHQTLIKSLHTAALNPDLELAGSPFFVVQATQVWEPCYDAGGQALPRRAGISALGKGGLNVHMVVEEYVVPAATTPQPEGPVLIVLSAHNGERLSELAHDLYQALKTGPLKENDLHGIAYTLQSGRDVMEERIGFVADNMTMLLQGLLQVAGQPSPAAIPLYRGQVKEKKEVLSVLASDEDMKETMRVWLGKGKYNKLLEVWVKGYPVDWGLLYGIHKPRRVSLPGYPFKKEKYWVPDTAAHDVAAPLENEPVPPARSLDELLLSVQSGEIDVGKADEILYQMNIQNNLLEK